MMETAKKPSFNPAAMSQGHRDRDITDDRYRDLRRPRKVKFFCNGDRYFKGKKVYVTPHRYLGFNDLLNDLTGKLPHSMQLPYGVRQVFSPSSGRKIRDIEELKDGHSYVCGGFEIFKPIRYGAREVEPWSHGKNRLDVLEPIGSSKDPQISGAGGAPGQRAIYGGFQPGRTLRQTYPYGPKRKQPAAFGGRSGPNSQWGQSATEQGANKPKVITVIRNGTKPRTNVKILLNRRSVQSFEYLMKDIADAFGPKWKNNKVRKLFTIKGKEVQGIADFFREDEVFIGLGNEPLTTGDVQDILEEVYPESQHPKTLMREWDKTKKRYAQGARKTEAFTEESKLDSGLGSDASKEGNDQASEVIYQPKPQDETRKKKKRKDKIHVVATEAVPEEEDLVEQVERERLRASEEEKEKARKRMQKRLDLEKRVLDDEKRKKNLVPPKQSGNDPFKQIQEDREREVEKDREREKQRLLELEEQKLTDEQSRVKAEERNKARKDIEKQREVEIGEKVMKDKEKRRTRSKERQTPQPKETDLLSAKDSDSAKKRDESGERSRTSKSKEREKVKEKEKDKERDKEIKSTTKDSPRKPAENKKDSEKPVDKDEAKTDKNVKSEVTPTNSGKPESDSKPVVDKNDNVTTEEPSVPKPQPADNKDGKKDETNKESNKENDEKKKDQDKDDKSKKKRSKTIIHKTKLERQISNTEHVLEKYEAGKVLGDGNFAIVKSAKLRNTNKEFAMKIIDKSKLKGKEQMIENEIALMKMCSQPNIVKLYEEFETKAEIYLIMELVKGGDLFDAITQSVKFGEPDSAGMVADLTNALFYLHSRSVVHRDLKPENLLVQRNKDSSITLKLADFGLAMEVKEPIYTVCGTPTYVAPEILCETGYGLEVDMWAVGVISYILLCGFPPFRSPDRNQTELFEFIKAGEYEFLSPYWDKVSRASKDLISRLLIVDKRKRYNAIDVLCHPWVITRGGTLRPAEPMDEHRKNLRKELEQQARQNRESFLNQKLGQA